MCIRDSYLRALINNAVTFIKIALKKCLMFTKTLENLLTDRTITGDGSLPILFGPGPSSVFFDTLVLSSQFFKNTVELTI